MEGLYAGERCNFTCIYKDYSSSINEEDKLKQGDPSLHIIGVIQKRLAESLNQVIQSGNE